MNVTRIVAAFVAAGLVTGTAMAQTKAAAPVAAPAAAPAAAAPAMVQGAGEAAFLQQGTIEYGGSVGYSAFTAERAAAGTVSLLKGVAELDYFVIDNLSIGLAGNLDWLRMDEYGTGVANATLTTGELVGRYHFPLCNNRVIPYVGASAGAGYAMADERADSGATIYGDGTMTDWGVQAGFLVPLNANVSLDTCIKWERYNLPGGWHTDLESTELLMGFKMKL